MLIPVKFETISVNQSEFMPLSKKQIAEAVGWAPSMLSRGRFKTMPTFETIEEFKQWDVMTRQRGTSKFSDEVNIPQVPNSFNDQRNHDCDTGSNSVVVDWKKFMTSPENHLDVTLQRGMYISNMAYALLDAAVERADIAATFGAIKNWSAALREESEVRGKLLQQRMDERSVIALDEVKNVVGLIVQELVSQIEAMLNRGALRANPGNPKLALEVYQDEFDNLKIKVQSALVRVESELGFEEEGEPEQCAN